MTNENCVFCKNSLQLDEEEGTVTLREKGCLTINETAKKRDDNINVQIGQKVHVKCRRIYTNEGYSQTQKRLRESQETDDTDMPRRSKSPVFKYESDCIFCGKPIPEYMFRHTETHKKHLAYKVRTTILQESLKTKCSERDDSWGKEVLSRIEFSTDLFASDCVYHQKCSVNFRTDREKDADEETSRKRQKSGRRFDSSREDAFLQVVNYFEENDEEQLAVSDLVEKMCEFSEEPFSVKHMKRRLQEYFGDRIVFTEINGNPNIVTARGTASKILDHFYNLPKADDTEKQKRQIIEATARLIQSDIKSMETNKDVYPTSESMSSLNNCLEYIPNSLQLLLSKLFVGKDTKLKEAAIGQCIVQAVRPRAVIAPIQLGLAVQLHLEYGSRFLIDNFNELGLCSSYSEVQRFLQSASVSQQLDIPGWTPDQQFMQYVADNVDHNSRTLDGLNTFHGMGMIVAVTPAVHCTRTVHRIKATKEDVAAIGKIDIHFYKGHESFSGVYKSLPRRFAEDTSYSVDILWKVSWLLRPRTPLWNGTMQLVHKGTYPGKSSVLFLPMIDLDPSNMSCIYSTLCFMSDQAGRYGVTPIVTFDQPLWIKAKQIIDSEPPSSKVKETVVRLGGFHMQMSFLGSIGHIMSDTGLRELFEVIYADNTVPHILSGKAIARAIRAHALLELALYALIISEVFEVNLHVKELVDDNDPELQQSCSDSRDTLPVTANDAEGKSSILTIQNDNPLLRQAVSQLESLMKQETEIAMTASDSHVLKVQEVLHASFQDFRKRRTSKLWIQYIEMLDILRMFTKAERTSDWLLHLQAVSNMLPYFAASGHNAYTKSAHIYLSNMADLKSTHPNVYDHFMNGHHAVRRSDRYWAGLSTDLVIEQMLMRSIKSAGGLTRGRGIDESQRALWILSRPACAEINEAMQELTGKKFASSEQHKECSAARMDRDNKDVRNLIEFLEERNPFSEDPDLRSIATGVVADKGVNVDEAKDVGERVLCRMVGSPVSEFTFKKKEQVVLMNDSCCVKIEEEEVSVDPQLLFQRLISAAQGSVPVDDLDTFFSHELCTYPSSIFESVHLLRESKKSVFAADIQKSSQVDCYKNIPIDEDVEYVLDGGSLIARLIWPRGHTYDKLCDMYVEYVTGKYKKCTVVFDGYEGGVSTKDNVHRRRTHGQVGTEVKVDGDLVMNTMKERFLANNKNKQKFIDLLSNKLRTAGVETRHAEADADLLILKTAVENSRASDTVVVGEDTDLLVLLCFHAKDLPKKVYLRPEQKANVKRAKTWDIGETREALGDEICDNILFLHAVLGCDTTSRPYGIGKGGSLVQFRKNSRFRNCADVFNKPPGSVTKEEIVSAGETAMVCLYSTKEHTDGLNSLRKLTFLDKVASNQVYIKPESLPPTSDACKYHSLSMYYQITEWKGLSDDLNAQEYGWKERNGVLEPRKTDRGPAPQNILKLIRCGCKSGCKSAMCTCRKLGLECSIVCRNCRGECVNSQKPDLSND